MKLDITNITPQNLKEKGIDTEGLVFSPNHLPYNPRLKAFSRMMRNHSEKAEALLWNQLKSKQTGYTFNRQKPILNYIADFYCKELSLVIEIDGVSHFSKEAAIKDEERDRQMQAIGLTVIRVEDEDVRNNAEHIAKSIIAQVTDPPPKSPSKGGLHCDF